VGGEVAVNEFEDRLAAVARMQADLLELVHRASLDVVAARKRLQTRIEDLEAGRRRVAEQHSAAAAAGEESADLLAQQAARAQHHIEELRGDLDGLREGEWLLAARAALMQDQITDFRNTMVLVSAKVVAARTSAVAGEALDTLRDALTYIELVVAEPKPRRTERREAPATPPPPPPPTASQPPAPDAPQAASPPA
jgi:phage shock protein A